jgi:lysophospholipase L1-like esterase
MLIKGSLLSTLVAIIFCSLSLPAQIPIRFQSEIDRFKSDTTDYTQTKDLILFTGSSTIRMWSTLKEDFPDMNVLNRGFGGSTMSELLYYADTLIIPYRPKVIFIYEGDNDLASGTPPGEILESAKKLVEKIRKHLPRTTICFFAAKPSLARWNLRESYLELNRMLNGLTREYKRVFFLDTWNPMLTPDGNVMNDLFVADGLHMNRKGYDIWKAIVNHFLESLPQKSPF